MSQHLRSDSHALSRAGREARGSGTRRPPRRLRRDLPNLGEFHVARLRKASTHLPGVRRHMPGLRRSVRADGRGRSSHAAVRRSLPSVPGVVRADGRVGCWVIDTRPSAMLAGRQAVPRAARAPSAPGPGAPVRREPPGSLDVQHQRLPVESQHRGRRGTGAPAPAQLAGLGRQAGDSGSRGIRRHRNPTGWERWCAIDVPERSGWLRHAPSPEAVRRPNCDPVTHPADRSEFRLHQRPAVPPARRVTLVRQPVPGAKGRAGRSGRERQSWLGNLPRYQPVIIARNDAGSTASTRPRWNRVKPTKIHTVEEVPVPGELVAAEHGGEPGELNRPVNGEAAQRRDRADGHDSRVRRLL